MERVYLKLLIHDKQPTLKKDISAKVSEISQMSCLSPRCKTSPDKPFFSISKKLLIPLNGIIFRNAWKFSTLVLNCGSGLT